MPARSCERGARMNRSRPPFRDRDAGARRAAQASVARNKRSPVPPPFETVATPGNGPSLAAASLPAGPSEPEDQPVPWGWQSTGSDLPPAGRWYDPAVYGSGNQVIVPPQEPPAQPQPVILSAEARGESFAPPGNAVRFSATATGPINSLSRIEADYAELLSFAILLEKMARDEIIRLWSVRPNDPHTIDSNKKECDLLSILADGFAKISAALVEYSKQPQPILAGKAKEIVDEVAAQLTAWWKKNAGEAIDWAVRIPTLIAGLAALGWAGADMTFATAAVSALVGGPKAIAAIKASRRKRG